MKIERPDPRTMRTVAAALAVTALFCAPALLIGLWVRHRYGETSDLRVALWRTLCSLIVVVPCAHYGVKLVHRLLDSERFRDWVKYGSWSVAALGDGDPLIEGVALCIHAALMKAAQESRESGAPFDAARARAAVADLSLQERQSIVRGCDALYRMRQGDAPQ